MTYESYCKFSENVDTFYAIGYVEGLQLDREFTIAFQATTG
jgi:hypothetical protein